MSDRPTSDQIEEAVQREIRALERRLTIEDERFLQSVREAAGETQLVANYELDAVEVGARLALRLICSYVGEARLLPEEIP